MKSLLFLILPVWLLGCTLTPEQQAFAAYLDAARYQTTYNTETHTSAGSAYCTTTCTAVRCVTSCDTYLKR